MDKSQMNDILKKICADKAEWIQDNKKKISESEMLNRVAEQRQGRMVTKRGFAGQLREKARNKKTGLIAEIKKASPSKGLIREEFNPSEIAKAYERGGATCISVLTDTPYFQGADEYLKLAKAACQLPILRKDFIIDNYQILESYLLEADCILLIMAALSISQAKELESTAHELGMDILLEVHDEKELEIALEHLSPDLLGINNRNLKTMEIDLSTTTELAKLVPDDNPLRTSLICESGIYSHADITQIQQSNIYCFLVGESLMRQDDVEQATKALLGQGQ